MKHVIAIVAALCGVVFSFAQPADACTRQTGVRDFTMFEDDNVAQNLAFGMVPVNLPDVTPFNGASGSRPTNPLVGMSFFDSTINKQLWCNQSN